VLLEKELGYVRQLDQRARGSRKAQRFPSGHIFDPGYQEQHLAELAAKKDQERVAREKRARVARAGKKRQASPLVGQSEAGPSTGV
jgi:hypothetical protein